MGYISYYNTTVPSGLPKALGQWLCPKLILGSYFTLNISHMGPSKDQITTTTSLGCVNLLSKLPMICLAESETVIDKIHCRRVHK